VTSTSRVQGHSVEEAPVEGSLVRSSPALSERNRQVGVRTLKNRARGKAISSPTISHSRWTVACCSSFVAIKTPSPESRSHLHRGNPNNTSAQLSTPPLIQMDTKQSPNSSLRSGNNQPESEADVNEQYEQYEQYSDGDSAEDNGERPRKRQRRPMSVS
jgi:hypothetical protein